MRMPPPGSLGRPGGLGAASEWAWGRAKAAVRSGSSSGAFSRSVEAAGAAESVGGSLAGSADGSSTASAEAWSAGSADGLSADGLSSDGFSRMACPPSSSAVRSRQSTVVGPPGSGTRGRRGSWRRLVPRRCRAARWRPVPRGRRRSRRRPSSRSRRALRGVCRSGGFGGGGVLVGGGVGRGRGGGAALRRWLGRVAVCALGRLVAVGPRLPAPAALSTVSPRSKRLPRPVAGRKGLRSMLCAAGARSSPAPPLFSPTSHKAHGCRRAGVGRRSYGPVAVTVSGGPYGLGSWKRAPTEPAPSPWAAMTAVLPCGPPRPCLAVAVARQRLHAVPAAVPVPGDRPAAGEAE